MTALSAWPRPARHWLRAAFGQRTVGVPGSRADGV